ncbi:MAG TPA: TonB-dependent receptor, partial [Thermoanaerobaculaceae bacterium]|nr:TonB-dependent receptor [Thermoanaerobaculaceae bacterium]
MRRRLLIVAGALTMAWTVIGQTPTGSLWGRITDASGEVLEGVAVTATSPNLQGVRTTSSSSSGEYVLRSLPPGDYSVRFERRGFTTLDASTRIAAAQTQTVNAELPLGRVIEEVTVAGSDATISTSIQAASTITFDLIDKLPADATISSYATLSAGTSGTGPGGALTISGAQSFENLFLVNGVNIQDNIRLTPTALYIEDAVEETTTQTAGISAEYGRFSGGVVNMLTRSGGNQVHGSLRLALQNEKWSNKTPLTGFGAQGDLASDTYIATLGGFVLRDRLWYFAAGRSHELSRSQRLFRTGIPYVYSTTNQRYEAKLTLALTPAHRAVGAYSSNQTSDGNYGYGRVMDLVSLYNRRQPSHLIALNTTSVLSDNLLLEAQYSRRVLTFENSGARHTDLVRGTQLIDSSFDSSQSYTYWSPTFCSVCGRAESRGNAEYLLKGSSFLSTLRGGTHDLTFGYDLFDDQRFANNHQSGSDWRIGGGSIIEGPDIFPVLLGDGTTVATYQPIYVGSEGTSFKTHSLFVNDRWRLGARLSLNLGVRYDRNDGKDSTGTRTARDSKVSPRLGVSWDVRGDGAWVVNASHGSYVSAISNSLANSASAGGQPATLEWDYRGPDINPPGTTSLVDSAHAIQMFFNWWNSVGGLNNSEYLTYAEIPGRTSSIKNNSLRSPSADEYTIGVTTRLGTRGTARADLVNRRFSDFYASRVDASTGTVDVVVNGTPFTFDRRVYENDDQVLERKYSGLQLSASYHLLETLSLGGTYTLSKTKGNFTGETSASGPVSNAVYEYPEYFQTRWAFPKGELGSSQRHKARAWVVWE